MIRVGGLRVGWRPARRQNIVPLHVTRAGRRQRFSTGRARAGSVVVTVTVCGLPLAVAAGCHWQWNCQLEALRHWQSESQLFHLPADKIFIEANCSEPASAKLRMEYHGSIRAAPQLGP